MSQKRPKIPDDVKLRLWAVSGARCEFEGCNKPLWFEKLTLRGDNFSEMAHILALNAGAARYDASRSAQLSTDIQNLMLLCRDHHHLIDSKGHRNAYPEERLREMKRAHEHRIFTQSSIAQDLRTQMLVFTATFGDRRPEVPGEDACIAALDKRYPSDIKGVRIDMTGMDEPRSTESWEERAEQITREVERKLTRGNDRDHVEHLSIFGFGPIPLLMHLGKKIGNARPTEVHQLHRDGTGWRWKEDNANDAELLEKKWPTSVPSNDVALVLSISGRPTPSEIESTLGTNVPIYEVSVADPSPRVINTRQHLRIFRKLFRDTLSEIRSRHGGHVTIHVLPAVPVSVAVACGQELLPKTDPRIIVYDHNWSTGGWSRTLTLNNNDSERVSSRPTKVAEHREG